MLWRMLVSNERGQSRVGFYRVAEAAFLGVMHWDLGTTQVIHQKGEVYGTLFVGRLTEDRPILLQAGEVSEWRWLRDDEALTDFSSLTAYLVQLVRDSC